MFNKLYKEANDEIPVNSELLKGLLDEASGKKKRPFHSFGFRYGYAAAAILIVTLSIKLLPSLETNMTPAPSPDVSATDSAFAGQSLSSVPSFDTETKAAKNAVNTTKAEQSENASRSSTAKGSISPSHAAQAAADEASSDAAVGEIAEESAFAQTAQEASSEASAEVDSTLSAEESAAAQNDGIALLSDTGAPVAESMKQASPAAGGSGVASSSSVGKAAHGFSAPNFKIPGDLSQTAASEGSDTENPFFAYSGNGRSLLITVFPDPAEVVHAMSLSETEDFSLGKIKRHSAEAYTAYMLKDGVGYVIESTGLSSDEISDIMNSIN